VNKELRPHPDHEWLLLYSDGELPVEVRAAMTTHLEACWECRHELQELQQTIGDAVRYRKEVLARHMPPPPAPWRDLSAGFAEVNRTLAPQSLFSRVGAALRIPRMAIPLAAAALGATILITRPAVWTEPSTVPAVAVPGKVAPENPPPPAPGLPASITPVRHETVTPPLVTPALATEADLAHSAVRVFAVLHELGADLGDPIEVTRANGRVHVRGYGLEAARIRELEPALKQVPFTELRWSERGAPETAGTVVRVGASAGASPFQGELERGLGGEAAVDEMASDALDHAESMMLRAYALRRLAEGFSNDALNGDDEKTLRAMRHEHAQALVSEIGRVERGLAPALRLLGANSLQAGASPANEATMLAAARRLETSIAELTGAKPMNGAAASLPNRIASDLAAAKMLAQSIALRQ